METCSTQIFRALVMENADVFRAAEKHFALARVLRYGKEVHESHPCRILVRTLRRIHILLSRDL